MKKIISVCLSLVLIISAFSACGKEKFKRQKTNLLAMCEAISDVNTEVESTLTKEYVSRVAGTLGVKSYRLWMHFNRILTREANSNKIIINQNAANKFHEFIALLKKSGVKRFICMTSNYLYPYGYEPTTNNVIPDPLYEKENYIEFLEFFRDCFKIIAEEFPEIDYFEPANEPDIYNGQNLCKNGYEWQGSDNGDYLWSDYDAAHIVADMMWYARAGVKEVAEKNKIVMPGLCGYSTTPNYLNEIYCAIESKTLPTGSDKAYVNPDDYFDILNWHPYLLDEGAPNMNDEWRDLQKKIYSAAEEHGDGDKPVWFTEIGFTDLCSEQKMEENADNLNKMLNYISKDLKFVESIFIFRVSNLTGNAKMNSFENNFGLFYSLNDEDKNKAGQPKPIAIALYKYLNGENADLQPLYNLAERN